ncbi:hypothetical protein GBAR_LOCUS18212 [Geodia barretti]|uniref:Uncharacterized protein n=1 Tax=Geodia barretti TaxID=519541 RepID=A0AA35WZ85_GEOBA|nr:hypothetical protein GBAR_LOCUS18212 [Geodia barretti]
MASVLRAPLRSAGLIHTLIGRISCSRWYCSAVTGASHLKHVECVMKDNVAVVRLNSPDNKVDIDE